MPRQRRSNRRVTIWNGRSRSRSPSSATGSGSGRSIRSVSATEAWSNVGVIRAAARVPVLIAPNLSPGVAALKRAVAAALAALPAYDVEIVERHHAAKVDSPSGTALALAQVVQQARPGTTLRAGREGRVGPRPPGEVGIHSLRGGGWIGEHEVVLAGPFESLQFTHVAHDRAAFAQGALSALRFVATARPGRYGLEDAIAV